MTVLLVDGMNVIGSVPDGWWRDRTAAMRRLVAALAELDEEVCVVFDGRPRDVGDGVEVRWAPVADDLIAELSHAGATVVTSDAALRARVHPHADLLGSRAFRRQIGF